MSSIPALGNGPATIETPAKPKPSREVAKRSPEVLILSGRLLEVGKDYGAREGSLGRPGPAARLLIRGRKCLVPLEHEELAQLIHNAHLDEELELVIRRKPKPQPQP